MDDSDNINLPDYCDETGKVPCAHCGELIDGASLQCVHCGVHFAGRAADFYEEPRDTYFKTPLLLKVTAWIALAFIAVAIVVAFIALFPREL